MSTTRPFLFPLILILTLILATGTTLAVHTSGRGSGLRRYGSNLFPNPDAMYKQTRVLGFVESPVEGVYGGPSPSSGPYFLPPPATEVTTRAGQSAALTCIVKNLGARQVSWIRGRDLHVLSSGEETFSSDARISASGSGEAWTLTLRYTQTDDGGRYGCQVNTQPPLLNWYNLTVVEARASIEGGGGTRYVQAGSTVTLHCVVREQLLIPGLVLWYQGDGLVEKDGHRVKIETRVANLTGAASGGGQGGASGQGVTTSILTVARAAPRDSGNYSCWPSAGRPDSVLLHVIQGERPAAMQHGNSSTRASTSLHLLHTLLHSMLLLLHLLHS